MTTTPEFADPVLTASLYCSGRLDDLIVEVVEPFWRELSEHDDARAAYLWMVRYGKCGEHLKLRLHGPATARPLARRLLARCARAYFDVLDPAPSGPPREARPEVPPIDVDDRRAGLYPDRALRWTRYRRSHVSLGGRPLLEDDAYAARLSRCLAGGCEIVLAALRPDGGRERTDRRRQNVLLKTFITAWPSLGLDAAGWCAYVTYHRDWLMRFASAGDEAEEARLRTLFAGEEGRLEGSVQQLSAVVGQLWSADGEAGTTEAEEALCRSLEHLVRYVTPLCEKERYDVDPFAPDPRFPILFKVFHGIANQLGFRVLQEAFAYHMLALAGATAGR